MTGRPGDQRDHRDSNWNMTWDADYIKNLGSLQSDDVFNDFLYFSPKNRRTKSHIYNEIRPIKCDYCARKMRTRFEHNNTVTEKKKLVKIYIPYVLRGRMPYDNEKLCFERDLHINEALYENVRLFLSRHVSKNESKRNDLWCEILKHQDKYVMNANDKLE